MTFKTKDLGLTSVTIDQDSVFLTITIGDDQIGGSKIYFAGDPTPLPKKGDFSHYLLGTRADLAGKTVQIFTTLMESGKNNIDITIGLDGTDYSPAITTDTFDNNDYYILKSQFTLN